jgi:hypothetical protein
MAKRMSLEAQLLYGTAGATATTLANNVRDLTAPKAPTASDISDRGSNVALYGPGQVDFSLQWESNWSDTDLFVQTLYAAAHAATIAGRIVALRTKDYSSGKGVDADFIVSKADHKQPLKEGQKVDFEAKPTDLAGRYPQLYV